MGFGSPQALRPNNANSPGNPVLSRYTAWFRTHYVSILQDPLQKEQQHESRQPQDPYHQCVGEVHPQGDAGVGRGLRHKPQGEKAQKGIEQELSREL